MVMKTTDSKPAFEESTRPVEMKRQVNAGGKSRRVGEIVEVNAKDFKFLTDTGMAIPYLGEPVVKKKATRKKAETLDNE